MALDGTVRLAQNAPGMHRAIDLAIHLQAPGEVAVEHALVICEHEPSRLRPRSARVILGKSIFRPLWAGVCIFLILVQQAMPV